MGLAIGEGAKGDRPEPGSSSRSCADQTRSNVARRLAPGCWTVPSERSSSSGIRGTLRPKPILAHCRYPTTAQQGSAWRASGELALSPWPRPRPWTRPDSPTRAGVALEGHCGSGNSAHGVARFSDCISRIARSVASVPRALPRLAWELQADILCPLPLTQILHPL